MKKIKYEQAKVLEDIIGKKWKKLPQVIKIEGATKGVKINNGEITGLGLSQNQIQTLPESIGKLKSLESLTLYDNHLSSLPESIGNLSFLTTLNLNDNQLTALPESIGNLKSLETLVLTSNQLKNLPDSIVGLSSLLCLYLGGNQLTFLPESIGHLKSLNLLGRGSNQSTFLPESIGDLKSLDVFGLAGNKLTALPESIGKLESLDEFALTNNNLTALSESIGNLSSLIFLYLNGNQLTILPESIGNITNLQHLYLGNNLLKTLPESIGMLKSLEELQLEGNPFNQEFSEMMSTSNPSYEVFAKLTNYADSSCSLLKTLEKKWLKKESERRIKIEKEQRRKKYTEEINKRIPIIEHFIQEKKFSDAIRDLNEIKEIAKRNHLGKILRWVERNLKLCKTHLIKKTVLELGIKYARLQIAEISEVCGIDDVQLIVDIVKDMIDNKEIYAQYFSSTKSVAFDQQANIDEIDKLMSTYKDWEDKKVGKI